MNYRNNINSYQFFIDNLNNPSFKIIDIRDEKDYNNSHIPNSINIPYLNLANNFPRILSKNYKYFIICSKGKTSNELVRLLNSYGYKTYNLTGGYDNFVKLTNHI